MVYLLLQDDTTHANLPVHEDVEKIVAPVVRKEVEVVVSTDCTVWL